MNEPWKGFVFLDVNDDLLQESHDLGCGLVLRKATSEEVLDRHVESVFRAWSERRGTSVFLEQRMPIPEGTKAYTGSVLQNPEEWRHAVVECADKNNLFWNVNLAFSISSADLRMGFVCFENNGYSTPFLEFPMLNVRTPLGAMFVEHKLPSLEDLPEIRENLAYVISNLTNEFPSEIRNIIHIFSSLDNLPDSSQLKVLGYFSVIEGLLSHPPLSSDRMDSIQRQLIRNINLLNNRLRKINREIIFSDYGDTKLKKVLEKLYAYRSSVAHGGNIDGPLKKIDNLRVGNTNTDHLWVHDWLRNMTKKVILAAIIEPDLVSDLK